MNTVRLPAVAGRFYPDQTAALAQAVRTLLAEVPAHLGPAGPVPKAIIVPHAGYIYSGSTAARAYAQLAPAQHSITRVILLGPAHRVPVRGLALPGDDALATPLGEVAVDQAALAQLTQLPQVEVSRSAHAHEHALEVQLPFLQTVLDNFQLVPLVVGDASPETVAQVLELLWGGPETLLVISSDLSHFLPYRAAQQTDSQTVQAILRLEGPLSHQQACGGTPINALLLAARRHGLHPQLLGMCNSGDSTGDKARVVGYAALAFNEVTHAH